MDIQIETPIHPQRRSDWLDQPLSHLITLDRAVVLLTLILLLTAVSRFWDLGTRALHHDESLHAVYSFYLYDRGDYDHQPLMHGPLLFHLTALGYWLFGATDATARLVPALLGIALAWLPWKFRDWLGLRGALAASFMVLISPSLLYYSRFIREDIFAITWTVIIVYGLWKYMDEGKAFHLYVMTAGWALLFSQKELSYLMAFVFWTFLAVLVGLRAMGRLGPKPVLRETREWHLLILMGALFLPLATPVLLFAFNLHPGPIGGDVSIYNFASGWPTSFIIPAYAIILGLFALGVAATRALWDWRRFLTIAALFWTIFILLHTTFLTNPFGVSSGVIGALGYWIEQQEVARGDQPWFYYLMLVPLYEFLPLLIALIGGGALLVRRRGTPLTTPDSYHLDARALWPAFNLWWFVVTFVLLSVAGEKMPWLLIHLSYPLVLLAGWVLGRFLDGVAWAAVSTRQAWGFAALFLLTLFAFLSICWLSLTQQTPSLNASDTAALQVTLRWVVTLAVLLAAGWCATYASEQLGTHLSRQVALLTLTLLLVVLTVRYAIIATYINADTPHEPLIFVQSSPSVTMVARDIAAISERIAGGKNLKVAYDDFNSWPFDWYLREYPNRFFYGAQPQEYADAIRDAAIVLVGHNNEAALKPLLPGYIRHEYPLRWWFPESYKNLTMRYVEDPDPADTTQTVLRLDPTEDESVGNVLRNLWLLAKRPTYRDDFWDFVRDREVKEPLGGENFIVYVKPEVAAEVWRFGVGVAEQVPTLPGEEGVSSVASFAELTVPLPATTLIGEPGQFASPKSVAALPDGTLAIADSGNHRIQLFEPDGTLIRQFGSQGSAPGQFNEPWGIAAAPDGTIYVADTWNHRVQHLDATGKVLHVWGEYANTENALGVESTFWGPRGIAVDGEGNVYVTDTGNKRIQKFDPTGQFLTQFGGGGTAVGQLSEPVGIAVAPDGTIYVADTWNLRIQSFSPDGEPLRQFPTSTWLGQDVMNKPYIAASKDRLWISDPQSQRIIEMDSEGTALRVWGQLGTDASGLNLPLGLTFDGERLWVADSGNGRVLGYEVVE